MPAAAGLALHQQCEREAGIQFTLVTFYPLQLIAKHPTRAANTYLRVVLTCVTPPPLVCFSLLVCSMTSRDPRIGSARRCQSPPPARKIPCDVSRFKGVRGAWTPLPLLSRGKCIRTATSRYNTKAKPLRHPSFSSLTRTRRFVCV